MKGAIFDIDGTLIDSMSAWTNTTSEFYRRHGLSLDEDEFNYFRSIALFESMPYIKNKYNLPESVEEIAEEFESIISGEYKYNIPIKQNADVYIRKLKSEGVKLAIATSSKPRYCEPALKRLGIFDMFDAICYSDEVGVNKSQPDIYLLAAEKIGVLPTECTVYEDILAGILSAKGVGFKTVAIYDNSNKEDTDLLKKSSDKYILSWDELI